MRFMLFCVVLTVLFFNIVEDEMETVSLPCPRQFCFPGVQCSIVNSQIHCGACPRGFFGNGFFCRGICNFYLLSN